MAVAHALTAYPVSAISNQTPRIGGRYSLPLYSNGTVRSYIIPNESSSAVTLHTHRPASSATEFADATTKVAPAFRSRTRQKSAKKGSSAGIASKPRSSNTRAFTCSAKWTTHSASTSGVPCSVIANLPQHVLLHCKSFLSVHCFLLFFVATRCHELPLLAPSSPPAGLNTTSP